MRMIKILLIKKHSVALMLVGITGLLLFSESSIQMLMYQRQNILHGELWRLLTAHFIHINATHWLLNMISILLALCLFDDIKLKDWVLLSILSSFGISMMLLVFNSDLEWYVGFSGVLHAWFIFGGINNLQKNRWLEGTVILGLIAVKITWEQMVGASSLSESLIQGIVVVNAHLFGVLCGVLFSLKTAHSQ